VIVVVYPVGIYDFLEGDDLESDVPEGIETKEGRLDLEKPTVSDNDQTLNKETKEEL